jgi:hypothetical protein
MADHNNPLSRPCKELEEDLVLFHYGELRDGERDALQNHLGSCASCAAYLQELGALLPLTAMTDEPPQTFWTDYGREMRHKISSVNERKSWRQNLASWFQPRLLPAFGVAVVVALALTFTIGKGIWRSDDLPKDDPAMLEVLPVAENLEFFKSMDVLDDLDLLEFMSSQGGAA